MNIEMSTEAPELTAGLLRTTAKPNSHTHRSTIVFTVYFSTYPYELLCKLSISAALHSRAYVFSNPSLQGRIHRHAAATNVIDRRGYLLGNLDLGHLFAKAH